VDQAWNVLLDVEQVAPCMPGATLDSVDGDAIKGRIKVKVGPISMTYAGTARFSEKDAAAGVMVLDASGKETRGAGTASATVRSQLHGEDGQTKVTVNTSLNVTGRPAQFGRGVMAEVGGKLIGIFAANLAAMLTSGSAAATSPADVSTADEVTAGAADATVHGATADGATGHGATADDTTVHGATADPDPAPEEAGDIPASTAPLPPVTPLTPVAPPTPAAAVTRPSADAPPRPAPRLAAVPAPPASDDSINLLSVAGLPLLKRAAPVLAGAAVVAALVLRRRSRRRAGR
jgi:carbon monoxide dehydrogenase subunit G